jgi:16S rRNA G966 N2-methylase RsmD
VEELAEQLEKISIYNTYTEKQLFEDWNNLNKWKSDSLTISSTNRIGLKLCEHFFPNFYDISDNKGNSFNSLWNKQNLIKILRWNRKSHSTPYLSELKRGIYFCCGSTKNTMYRPQMAKMICDTYKPKIVLDPCMGWGGRLLGTVSSGAHYIGFDPNTKTFEGLQNLVKFLNIQDKVTLICDDAMNMHKYNLPKIDLVITSPPYFDLEVYSDEPNQSIEGYSNYQDWSDNFLKSIIEKSSSLMNDGGVSCWNVGKVGKYDMNIDVAKYHEQLGFNKIQVFSVVSSKRQSLQKTGSDKSVDVTVIFKENK